MSSSADATATPASTEHHEKNTDALAGHPKAVMAGGMRVKQAAHHHPVKPASRMGLQEKNEAERVRKASESGTSEGEGDSTVSKTKDKSKPPSAPHLADAKEPYVERRSTAQTTMPIQQPR